MDFRISYNDSSVLHSFRLSSKNPKDGFSSDSRQR